MNSKHILPEVVEKIKSTIHIEELIREDGVELKQHSGALVGYHSNKHDSESKTSLHVDPVQSLYHCFNCGEGGDIFTWFMLNRHMNFMEALRYLADKAGIELPEISPEEQQRQNERRQEQLQLWDLFTAAAEIYHKMLGKQGHKLLMGKWGLTAETAKKYLFGYAPGGKFLLQKLKERGFSEELIKRSGLINKGGYDYFQKRLIFTYWKNGRVVYFIARQIDGITPDTEFEQAKFKKLPVHNDIHSYISTAVSNEFFAGEDTCRGVEELIITEGIADCYAAIQAGFPCISPVTVQFRKADFPRLAMLVKRAKIVYICNDNEENKAGEKGALATAEYLEAQGINVKIIELPLPKGRAN